MNDNRRKELLDEAMAIIYDNVQEAELPLYKAALIMQRAHTDELKMYVVAVLLRVMMDR